jgi:ribosomal protein L11 methyltransferase
VRAARANAARNSLAASFEQRAAGEGEQHYDVVVANIEAGVLLAASAGIVRCLGEASQLALAGFIEEQEPELLQHYRALGVVLQRVAQEGDWCLLAGRPSFTGKR